MKALKYNRILEWWNKEIIKWRHGKGKKKVFRKWKTKERRIRYEGMRKPVTEYRNEKNECINEWGVTQWLHEGMNGWRNEGVREWRNGKRKNENNKGMWICEIKQWMNEWMNKGMNEATTEWMDNGMQECNNSGMTYGNIKKLTMNNLKNKDYRNEIIRMKTWKAKTNRWLQRNEEGCGVTKTEKYALKPWCKKKMKDGRAQKLRSYRKYEWIKQERFDEMKKMNKYMNGRKTNKGMNN